MADMKITFRYSNRTEEGEPSKADKARLLAAMKADPHDIILLDFLQDVAHAATALYNEALEIRNAEHAALFQ